MSKTRTLLSWSTGKDSAWALHVLRSMPQIEVVGLLTTYNAEFKRVAMHAVRLELLEAQADALGLPLLTVGLPWPCPNDAYEEAMRRALERARTEFRASAVAFGDLYLEDVRRYREERMAGTGIEPLFPLWSIPTRELAYTMVRAGLKARVTCVDPRVLPKEFAGRPFDEDFLAALPQSVDPCAERGEFHTFAWDGPMFSHPVEVTAGEVVERDGFVFADLLPLHPRPHTLPTRS